ncbi:hypothetical protein MSAN_01748700 [Mycena sanguinolenta]|uniref:Uncharacterized protein n=1 Tax=Mycena sanguinolenta TaxID=230812 RepID=A0A8H7CTZ6_9AGAR|nr:hypothetical protein MSAN_01748700 [Mycena sanguinolenta]
MEQRAVVTYALQSFMMLDLIPLQQFLTLYRHSHFSTVYIHAYVYIEYKAAGHYIWNLFQHIFLDAFIRRSTGRFCADIVPESDIRYTYRGINEISTQQGLNFLAGKNAEATIIDSLTLHQYHQICAGYWEFSKVQLIWSVPTSVTVNLGSVVTCAAGNLFNDVVEIAWLPNVELPSFPGRWERARENTHDLREIRGEIMEDGWTRVNSDDAVDMEIATITPWLRNDPEFWLSQANHIFTQLQVLSNLQGYGVTRASPSIASG